MNTLSASESQCPARHTFEQDAFSSSQLLGPCCLAVSWHRRAFEHMHPQRSFPTSLGLRLSPLSTYQLLSSLPEVGLKAVRQLRDAGYKVERVVTIVDREEGGDAAMTAENLKLISLFKLSEIAAFTPA